jgi:hypothetical protein
MGNADEKFIQKHLLELPIIGVGYKGEWFIDVRRCVENLYSYFRSDKISKILLNFMSQDKECLRNKSPKEIVKEIEEDFDKSWREQLLEEEFVKEALKTINRAVLRGVIYAYGDISPNEVFLCTNRDTSFHEIFSIKYKNKKEKEKIFQIFENLKISDFFSVDEYQGLIILEPKLELDKKYNLKEMRDLIKNLRKFKIKVKRGISYETESNKLEGLLKELEEFNL